jgi:hypothetical protein
MTEAVVNELELVDILPKLLNRDLFSERKMKEMNEEERTIFKKIDMEAKLDEFNIHEWLEDMIFDGDIYFDDFNNFIYYNDDDFYEQIVDYYEKDNLFGIDLILLKRKIDIFEKIDQSLDYFWNIVVNILEDPLSESQFSPEGDEWYFLKDISKNYNKIKKYRAKIKTTMLNNNVSKLNRLYYKNNMESSIENDYIRKLINKVERKIQMLLDHEEILREIKNEKMNVIIEDTVINLLKENKTVEEIAEITNFPEVLIESEKERLSDK